MGFVAFAVGAWIVWSIIIPVTLMVLGGVLACIAGLFGAFKK